MDDGEFYANAASLCAMMMMAILIRKRERKQRPKRLHVRPWVARRETSGIHNTLLGELRLEDPNAYRRYLRMDEETFVYIITKVKPLIERQNTHLRNAISVDERVSVTLRFLATGESYSSLWFSTRIPQCTLSGIIPETCRAIYNALKEEFLKVPTTEEEWKNIAREFQEKWNVYNTIGAMDGKHIRITCPRNGGSRHWNYKSYNSIILFALVDAHYRFIYVDVGTNGSVGDAGVFAKSALRHGLMDRRVLHLPPDAKLPNTNLSTPYVVLADDAFPLSYNVMKPYPMKNARKEEKIFNYRLSRGRRMVESAFGILASRFRVFLTHINLAPSKVTTITLAAIVLHNLLTEKRKHLYTQRYVCSMQEECVEYFDERCSEEPQQMQHLSIQKSTGNERHGNEIREIFKAFYNGAGKVPWQEKYI